MEKLEWFLGNNTKVRIAWKEPNNVNGIIQNYLISYTVDVKSKTSWSDVTVPGNKTSMTLLGLAPGKEYLVMMKAATKAGYGETSDPIIVITGGSTLKPTSDREPSQNPKPDQSLGKEKMANNNICTCLDKYFTNFS